MFRVPFRLVNSHILDTSLALDSSNTCGCRHHAGPFDKQTKYEIKAHPRGDSDEIKMEITLSCIACLHSHWTHCQVGPRKKTRKLSTKKGRERETENKTSTFFPKVLDVLRARLCITKSNTKSLSKQSEIPSSLSFNISLLLLLCFALNSHWWQIIWVKRYARGVRRPCAEDTPYLRVCKHQLSHSRKYKRKGKEKSSDFFPSRRRRRAKRFRSWFKWRIWLLAFPGVDFVDVSPCEAYMIYGGVVELPRPINIHMQNRNDTRILNYFHIRAPFMDGYFR